ncbi:unnamed protein product [marine sediment metagenome]|uniref:Tyrosine specific protein phosphatases domain-containing protein n=1 Tax=marine sediment metagenome TaxID=412755 RepID=X0U8N1_9ZZZZ
MFEWIIEGRLGKAGRNDMESGSIPDPCLIVLVAAEYEEATVRLVDEPLMAQLPLFTHAVTLTLMQLALYDEGTPIVLMCQQGRSRSVTVAVMAAALWQGRSYWDVYNELKAKDPGILDPSPLLSLAQRAFPHYFLATVNK